MKANEYLAQFLEERGIDVVFEVTGGMITLLLDAIARRGATKLLSVHHEQAAAFAAEGYGRVTGKPGVAFATSGPGATNLLTGMGSCYFDSVPAVFITGQVNTHEQRGDRGVRQLGFQETDIAAMARPVVKRVFEVRSAAELPEILDAAFRIAVEGRPGPVLVDIAMNVQLQEIEAPPVFRAAEIVRTEIAAADLAEVHALLAGAERPLVLAGGGLRSAGASADFRTWTTAAGVPVAYSLLGVDALPFADPLRVGMIGSYGNRWANHAVHDADVILVLGSRLDIRQTGADVDSFARGKTIVHVDVDAPEMNNRVKGCRTILAHLRDFLAVVPGRPLHPAHSAWRRSLAQLRDRWPDIAELGADLALNPNAAVHALTRAGRAAAGWSVDVGQHQMWAAQSAELAPHQRMLTSGGMGAMGFALPAAVGWAAALHGKQAVGVLAGDGGFQLNIQELQTIRRNDFPVKIVIFNNGAHGMVRQFQETYLEGRYHSTMWGYSAPDFVRVAEAYGIPARRVENDAEMADAAERLFAGPGPALLDVTIETRANAYPKLAFGRPITEMEPLAQPVLMEST